MSAITSYIKKKRIPAAAIFLVGFLFLMVSCSIQESPAVRTPFNASSTPQKVFPTGVLSSATPSPIITLTVEFAPKLVCSDFGQVAIADSYKNKVVYQAYKLEDSIKVRDITTMQETVIAKVDQGDHRTSLLAPQIFEDWVVWAASYGPEEQQVFVRNIMTGDAKRISSQNTVFATEPSIYGTNVVWTALYKGEKYYNHLLLYDLKTNQTREIKINTQHEALIQAKIWDDWLAVTSAPPGGNGPTEVVAHNLTSGKEWVLPNSRLAELQGDTLIYRDASNSKEACTYNLLTHSQNCFAHSFTSFMDIWGNWVAWRTYEETKLSLYNLANNQISSFEYGGSIVSINDHYLIWNRDKQICYIPVEQIPSIK